MDRLDRLALRKQGGLAVLYGRRRIGKTRLLLEWTRKHGGLYTVADQSSAEIQRAYFARAVGESIPGFADVAYPDWRGLLSRLAREARLARWRGPIVFDELPYLVVSSPELPSVLQRWVDHEAKEARLLVALAGSSQRMMQGLVLSGSAPLYGRAQEILDIGPLAPQYLRAALRLSTSVETIEAYAAWGGVPRYWELAKELTGHSRSRVQQLVLDPLGPLFTEPDRLLIEEVPPALEVRAVLDAIGAGAHRVSEIAGRIGRPATSMSRPLERLIGMGLARRDVPFGESARKSRRSLYKINDPFFRLWFRVVAPHRGQLASGSRPTRMELLKKYWDRLVAEAWEELCRQGLPRLSPSTRLGKLGPWGPAARWWRGTMPEWDIVSESVDRKHLLLGEVKWSTKPLGRAALARAGFALLSKPAPPLQSKSGDQDVIRALFVPQVEPRTARRGDGYLVVTGSDVI